MGKRKRQEAPRPEPRGASRWAWVLLGLTLAFVVVVRVRLLAIPIERDEGEYAYAGQLILHGIPPYTLAYNMKLPGIYYAYAFVMALFGRSPAGIHMGLLLVNAGAIVLVFLIARKLFDGAVGVVAAAAYGVLTLTPSVLGAQAHATHFVVLPALGGILLAVRAAGSRRLWFVIASGLLLGVSLTMKQQGAFYAAFAFVYLAWNELRRRPAEPRVAAVRLLAFVAASCLPLLALCGILAASGTFGRFWFWAVSYAGQYVSEVPARIGVQIFAHNTMEVIRAGAGLWGAAAAGLVLVWLDRESRPRALFVTGLFASSFLTICPGFYFRAHYYVTWLPAIALLVGIAFGAARNLLRGALTPALSAWIPGAIVATLLATPLWAQRQYLFTAPPEQVSRAIYGQNPWPESRRVAAYIAAHSRPTDTIAVLGSEPQIYFFADRRSATGYIYTYPLMEPQHFASTMQSEMIEQIRSARPRYVVFVNIATSWLWSGKSDMTLLKWAFEGYLKQNYDLVGYTPPYRGPGSAPAADAWGAAAARHSPAQLNDGSLYVFERK